MNGLTLTLEPLLTLSDEQFYKLCLLNRELRLERTAGGELIIMSPAGSRSGERNAGLIGQLWFWNQQARLGRVFDSSAGFILANGAIRSPDAAWVAESRWNALSPQEQEQFAPLWPDFVVELRCACDQLQPLQAKVQEYLDNGTRLGWLIDPQNRRVEIYRPGEATELLQSPSTLSGEALLPGFRLDLREILA